MSASLLAHGSPSLRSADVRLCLANDCQESPLHCAYLHSSVCSELLDEIELLTREQMNMTKKDFEEWAANLTIIRSALPDLEVLLPVLEKVEEWTELLSQRTKPTAGYVLPFIHDMKKSITPLSVHSRKLVKQVGKVLKYSMEEYFNKGWEEWPGYKFATLLDPTAARRLPRLLGYDTMKKIDD